MKNTTTLQSKRSITVLLGVLLYFSSLSAQTMQDTIIANFSLMERIPKEKLYLHLDKPFYGAGEKIWFKGYLVNATTHQDNSQSNFIITELINRSDSIVERKKIRRDSLGFHNAFTLPATLPAGDYYLRGYSNWMLNEDPDFFFSRNIKIGNSIDNTIVSSIEYQQEDDTHYTAKIKFTSNVQAVFENTTIKYLYLENGKIKNKGKKKTDENGWISISLPDLKSPAARRIEVEFDDPQYIYKRTFHLPVFTNDFDVKFFPEGGALLSIPHQNVAFKAQGADGFSKEVEGFLFNSKGDTLTNFRSEHNGMGIFTMNPVNNETYYVTVRTNDSITKRFDLPAIEPKGISIAMSHYKQEIRYEIQKTEATEWPQKLFLLAHTRGKLAILQPINPKRTFGKMNDSLFTEGITHFMLIDEQGNALSERLIFVPDHKPNQWQITADQPTYGKREKVSLQIAAKDNEGNPVEGTFSVSITDRKSIQPDSLADNILSNLLLTSDLKGYVEDPAYYFLNQDARTLRSIDYLMMTHGWRRHKMENVLRTPSLNFTNYIEKGQTISGRIMGFFGANVKKGPICVLAPKYNIIATTETDEKGQFIVNTSFRDSTTFLVQARTKKGFAGVDILMDPPQYPVATHKAPYFNGAATFMEDYLMNTRDQYYMEGGMRVYNLKEVTVTAKRERPSSKSIYTGGINTYTVEEDRLQGYGQTAFDAASRLPSVTITNGSEIHIRNNSEPAIIVIDDIVYEDASDILKDIQVSDMSSISLLRGADAVILGPRASGGAVVITLKDPRNLPARPAQGIITYTPLGYSESVEFYHPTYDTPEKKNAQRSDFRSTVYWNPELRLDAEGKATIEYYTPDSTAPEDIIIEGVDKNGKVCRILQTINK
ncbi:TonB-dependent receptor plug domain-containing protein [Bacteroides thetaiotaomicron]|uniref:TonB-dependent receptor plug domain-containing protein n=1 Tax=Bacteroides thetaiotaomicron TaxID=818 RepID=UPI00189AB9C1|nr:TonB-dependent receptor plug domain-containing protein [Bacteroides thetaiotaomicron]MCB7009406.1 TonB-dependent receptor plug domain-containing protein [Bacteroides thetaiotaomicron]MCB7366058.1 TonB-dependent receptor plug domain-containing protein [Bacteroides thetaiotaomicron]MCQ5020295.1 TonB-dependent receptor plug domain-containing protein [Bacteroides thetaiotaomicron]MCQ5108346.1 TonB-dependent receptor plug domain-containing protein [Bacteroides thetaiotaomicron]MDC2278119.1 TonB-